MYMNVVYPSIHCPLSSYHLINVLQNHRMLGVGRDLCGSASPTPLPSTMTVKKTAIEVLGLGRLLWQATVGHLSLQLRFLLAGMGEEQGELWR